MSQLTYCDVTKMLGFRSPSNGKTNRTPRFDQEGDVAKLFFDTFSSRLGSFEEDLRQLSLEVHNFKVSGDQSKLSDLVLLERLQNAEKILRESLSWIKQVADAVLRSPSSKPDESDIAEGVPDLSSPAAVPGPQRLTARVQTRSDPSIVQLGSLNSITTPTELQVLTLLANEGPKSAPEIGKYVGRSREHTARLMKKLFDEGYVRRDQTRIPFRYSTVERVKNSFTQPVPKDSTQELSPFHQS